MYIKLVQSLKLNRSFLDFFSLSHIESEKIVNLHTKQKINFVQLLYLLQGNIILIILRRINILIMLKLKTLLF